jgi:hypothetical protein
MKNFANLTLDVLSNEELMAVRGGDSPVDVPTDPIVIKGKDSTVSTLSISTTITKK